MTLPERQAESPAKLVLNIQSASVLMNKFLGTINIS